MSTSTPGRSTYMTRYVIYSDKLDGYFHGKGGKSLYYNEKDFTDTIDDAKWHKQESIAVKKAMELHANFKTIAIEININVTEDIKIDIASMISEKIAEAKATVKRVKALDSEATEALPLKEWKYYKSCLVFIREYEEEK